MTSARFHICLPLGLAIALGLTGCNVVPTARPTIALPLAYAQAPKQRTSVDPALLRWWEGFGDRQLDTLMKRGQRENLSLKQAMARLGSAYAAVAAASAGNKPTITAGGGLEARQDRTGNTIASSRSASGTLGFVWDLDLFGRTRNARLGAEARYLATAANARAVRLIYQTDLVSTYIDLQYFRQAVVIGEANVASYRRTLTMTREMRREGVVAGLDVAQAQALVDSARAELPALRKGMKQAENHLATLLGTTPAANRTSLPGKARQPVPRRTEKAGVPADLLRNRPDIQREEYLLAAAAADIGLAKAQLYPALSLAGSIDIAELIASGASTSVASWAFGPSVIGVLLDGGRLRANVDIARSESRAQYFAWKQSVLAAVEEVENALSALHEDSQEVKAYQRMAASYETTRRLATESYQGGVGALLDVLSAERSLGEARLALAESRRNLAKSYVALQVAIGAGSLVREPLERLGSLRSAPVRPVPLPTPVSGPVPLNAAPTVTRPRPASLRLRRQG